jgi:hypothetical protein
MRLLPLRPPALPENLMTHYRKKYEALRADGGQEKKVIRQLRLEFRRYPWVSRDQVEVLMKHLEGQQYVFPEKPVPNYWTPGLEAPGYIFQMVSADSELARFQALFDLSARQIKTMDRKLPLPDRFVVQRVERIENEKDWSEFVERRNMIAKERWGGFQDNMADENVLNLKIHRPLLPGQAIRPNGLQEHFVPNLVGAQELYLLHGTSREGAMNIARVDFSTEFSNEHGLYGAGLYFAESVTKADEYCLADSENGICTMLLCRVCIGSQHAVDSVAVDVKQVMQEMREY